ncbi:protein C3orf33 homolog isoform X2 [Genypterus blacodes]|uniref:protein C3orf33 homolog isoform X2 n=1 Tax=Genypterus blacodes TaxID=154954 RepID=UPI003F777B62
MPESAQETESERSVRDMGQSDGRDQPSHNIVSVVSQFADDNLTFVRNISTGLAIAGVIVMSRSIRLITQFHAASEIPARFIERNVSLRGKVCTVTEKGLELEHVPIYVPGLSPLLSRQKGVCVSPLVVHLAGVELTPEGRVWLERHLVPEQRVWFKLISREDNILHCLVSHSRGSMWSYCMNDEVLKLGLARTAPVAGVLPNSRLYWRLHKRLHRAEVKAERKGRGIWKEDSLWERLSRTVRENPFFRLVKRLFKRT